MPRRSPGPERMTPASRFLATEEGDVSADRQTVAAAPSCRRAAWRYAAAGLVPAGLFVLALAVRVLPVDLELAVDQHPDRAHIARVVDDHPQPRAGQGLKLWGEIGLPRPQRSGDQQQGLTLTTVCSQSGISFVGKIELLAKSSGRLRRLMIAI